MTEKKEINIVFAQQIIDYALRTQTTWSEGSWPKLTVAIRTLIATLPKDQREALDLVLTPLIRDMEHNIGRRSGEIWVGGDELG